jgi:hypothetical protein
MAYLMLGEAHCRGGLESRADTIHRRHNCHVVLFCIATMFASLLRYVVQHVQVKAIVTFF